MIKRVAIIGGNAREEYFSPGKGAEIWGLNAIRLEWVPYWSRMFNLHRFKHLRRDWPHGLERERKWLQANEEPVPFYVCDRWPNWATGQKVFPRKELAKMPRGDYHAGSFDWMVAFAVHLGFEEISLHGVGLNLNLESGKPISARACLEYWCGYATGKGIMVTTSRDCDLFYQYHLVKSNSVYGYDDIKIVEDRTK